MQKKDRKIPSEELQQFLAFRKRSFKIENKVGKGSYTRKEKYRTSCNEY